MENSEYLENSKYEHTSYLEESIRVNKLRDTVKCCVMALSKHKFDAIAFRGLSGSLVAPAVALAMNKEMIAVRKDCEFEPGFSQTHSSHKVEGFKASKRYVIIDDLICSGRTAKAIIEAVKHFAPMAECVGLLEANYAKRDTHKWIDGFGEIIRACDLWVPFPTAYNGFTRVEFTKHVTPRPKMPSPKPDLAQVKIRDKYPDMPINNQVTKPTSLVKEVEYPKWNMSWPNMTGVVDNPAIATDFEACENRVLDALEELDRLTSERE